MKIAVVAPSPVPFTIGGMENLAWGLCEAINRNTCHQAELIKLPSREQNFWDLIQSYYDFYCLDLSYYDFVITTKYPSWMIKHKKSACYMVHTLRGLYDTYHLMNQSMETDINNIHIKKILDYIEQNRTPDSLDHFFHELFALKEPDKKIPEQYFQFPGPFIRNLIHYMDQWALSRKSVDQIFAISNTIKKRTEYFPENTSVEVVYPPVTLKKVSYGDYKYIFMISRLDGAKRIDMLIRSMKYVTSNTKLLIAGTGPEEQNLKKLAADDPRIEFLGFVSDEAVDTYYANCSVVPYFPYDEDYGYITLEAMLHKKPVITTFDSGGPNEFVINGETGFIISFTEKEIAKKIDYIVQHPDIAREMGEKAYQNIKNISWESVLNQLLSLAPKKPVYQESVSVMQTRKKITVTSTFPIYPPQGGGQARIFNLYKNLAKYYDVEIISFTNTDQRGFSDEIAPGLKEIRIPKSQEHQDREWEIEKKIGIPITDIGMITLSKYTQKYGECLEKSIQNSDLTIISHPYLYNEAKKYLAGKKFIYEAHNVESIMKQNMLPESSFSRELVKLVFETEKECCDLSEFIMTCSEEDQITLHDIYNVSKSKMIVVPNGVDSHETTFTDVNSRLKNKFNLGLSQEKLGLFMGSWHGPNLEAAEKIIELAPQCPDTKFLLMGSQCGYFEKRKLPANIGLLGLVDEISKNRIFGVVDFALNPMLSGSGTNLKMFDYMSAGIPVITTEFGMRGINNKEVFIVSPLEDMKECVNDFNIKKYGTLVNESREYVEKEFDWSVISENLLNRLKQL